MDRGHDPLVTVEHLRVSYPVRRSALFLRTLSFNAVDDVTLQIPQGSTLGLVGESGSGKSTLARAVVGVRRPSTGSVEFDGVPLFGSDRSKIRRARRNFQMVSQDPFSSLNPRMKVLDIVREPLLVHRIGKEAHQREKALAALEMVGLQPQMADRYPHQFSGGQRQRISIARAIVAEPKFLVLDEPVSSLDVSMQAQVMNLLIHLRRQLGLTYLFIAHDLAVVRLVADIVAVMHLGQIVEQGPADALFRSPAHPYTRALVSAILPPDPKIARERQRLILTGEVPSPIRPPSGCRFHTRCWLYNELGRPERCRSIVPPFHSVGTSHESRCHFAETTKASKVGAVSTEEPAWKRELPGPPSVSAEAATAAHGLIAPSG